MAVAKRYGQLQDERSNIALSDDVLRLRKQLESDRKNPDLWFDLAMAYRRQMLVREAVECLGLCISYDPLRWKFHRYRGHFNINLGRYGEAVADLSVAAALDTQQWDIWYHLGLAHFLCGNYEKARDAYEKSLALAGDEPYAQLVWLWNIYKKLGDEDGVARIVAQMVDPDPLPQEPYYYEVAAMYAGRRTPENLMEGVDNPLELLTKGYPCYRYLQETGREDEAKAMLARLAEHVDDMWSGFAAHAVRVELAAK